MNKKILVVEDDVSFANILQGFLTKKQYVVEVAYSYKRAGELWASFDFDMVISDYRLPDGTGLEFMQFIREKGARVPFIIMTAFHDIRTAVRSMKSGAYDYITKPVNPDELLMLIESGFKQQEQHGADAKTAAKNESNNNIPFIKGESNLSKQLYEYIELVAPTNMSVIVQGESGTGKEYVARTIHAKSARANKPFVAIDCGVLTNDLASSELFGYVKGAFTGALQNKKGQFEFANGGTLFLDEIGNLNYDVQVKLLRTLQEKVIQPMGANNTVKIDVRILVATNDDLLANVKANKFREDLYHRLNEFNIKTPPLRKRNVDLALFVNHFITQANHELNKQVKGVDQAVFDLFLAYDWPGNLRELKNVVKRAVLLTKGNYILPDVLPDEMLSEVNNNNFVTEVEPDTPIETDLKSAEKMLIEKTLKEVKYNKTKAAQLLNIDRKTLYNKMQKYNL